MTPNTPNPSGTHDTMIAEPVMESIFAITAPQMDGIAGIAREGGKPWILWSEPHADGHTYSVEIDCTDPDGNDYTMIARIHPNGDMEMPDGTTMTLNEDCNDHGWED